MFRKIFTFLSVSSLWISACASVQLAVLFGLAGKGLDPWLCLAVGLVTFAIYSIDKLGGSAEDLQNTPERAWLRGKPILPLAILAYLVAIGLVFFARPAATPYILLPGLFGAIYTARLPCVGRPKDIFLMKNILVGLATAACHVGLVGAGWQLFGFVFFLTFVDTALFDIRDTEGDRLAGVRTLPVVAGVGPALLCLATVIELALFIYPAGRYIVAYGLVMLWYFRKKRDALAYNLLIEPWWSWILFQIPSWGMCIGSTGAACSAAPTNAGAKNRHADSSTYAPTLTNISFIAMIIACPIS